MKKIFVILAGILMFTININAQTIYTVTKTGDYDPFIYQYNYVDSLCDTTMYGTLQWATRKVNDTFGPCEIRFAIAGAGQHTIFLSYELPVLMNATKIDGTTQPGYQYGSPTIIIDGQNLINTGIYYYNVSNSVIKGLQIQNFSLQGILLYDCINTEISDNIINRINNVSLFDATMGIRLINSNNSHITGNFIGTDYTFNSGKGCDDYGILIQYYSFSPPGSGGNNFIGGSGVNQGNTIAYNGVFGILIGMGSSNNLISRNRIFDNPIAINLQMGANQNKQAPVITSATNSTISGTSAPNDIIEIFGSTGNENANEYLETTQTDVNGNWTTSVNTTYNNIIATATDVNNNTSIFSQSLIYQEDKWIRIAIKDSSAIPINGIMTANTVLNNILLSFNVDKYYQTFSFTKHQELKKYYTIHTTHEPDQLLDTLSEMTNLFLNVDFWKEHKEAYTTTESSDYWDPFFWTSNWQLYDINAQGAWDITHGCPDIKIGIVDSKIAGLHEELSSKLLYPYDPLSGYSFVNNCYFPMGDHGTRVAGTAAGATDNGLGGASIGFNTKLVAYERKYHCDALGNLDYTLQPYDYAYQACLHAAEVENVDVLSISWYDLGCGISNGSVTFYNDLIESINSEGTIIVVAGCNQDIENWLNNPLNCPPGMNNWYPYNPPPFSKYINNKVIVVSGINRFDNYDASEFYEQQATDICAPGVMFLAPSSNFINPPCTPNNNYALVTGTSFATPIVSGTIALMKCVNPCLTLEQIRQILISTANPINNGASYSQYIGGGRLNAQAAVQLAQSTVPINPIPTFTTTSLCTNNPVQFTYTGSFVTSWQWDFGDGNSSTQQNPSHTYLLPGYYQVGLTVSNSCGSSSNITQYIYIYPNCCALPLNIAYDDDNPLLNSPITSSTVWNSSYNNFKINKTIVVQAPAILTIQSGVTIEFGPLGKIIVENGISTTAGAQLIIQTNSKLTSITKSTPSCHVMWQGVEVWGVYANSSSNSLGQGKITLAQGSTIENAHIGVLLGKTNICYPPPPPCPNPPCIEPLPCSPWDLSHGGRSGGIIIANGTTFNNNAVSIRFLPYIKNNTSRIQSCTFTAAALLDLGYKTGNSYTYPNNYNRYYAPNNTGGMGAWHTHLWKVNNVKFYDNTFNTVWAEAILAIDSRIYVNKLTSLAGNSFNNSNYPTTYGIHTVNTINSPSTYHQIINNTFNMPWHGINIDGNQGSDLITGNQFNNNSSYPAPYTHAGGIYLINSSGFSVCNMNYFNMLDYGVVVNNSGIGGGNVGFPNGNYFTKCRHNIYTYGSYSGLNSGNPNLQIKCNNFDNPYSLYYTTNTSYNIQSLDNIPDQGSYPANLSEDKKPAGNEFWQVQSSVPNTTYRNDIISSDVSYTYYRHHRDINGGWRILPNAVALGSPITINENLSINVNKTNTSCKIDPCLPPCTIFTQLNDQTVELQILKQEFNNVFANLDKGQTQQLIVAINSNTPTGQLKNMLINNAPLSDEVLFAFINRQISTPPGIFKEAITPNMPVSDTVNNALLLKLNTIPPGIANQIKNLQGYNPGFRTLTAILRDISTIENERAYTLSQTISYYVQNDSLNNLTNLLENENTDYANQLLAGLYIADNNLALASLKLNSLPNSTFVEQAFININNMLINLATEEKTVFEMDSMQEQLVRQIATMNSSCLARSNARAILLLVYNERYDEEIPQINSARMAGNNTNNNGLTNSETGFSIYPNPASENVELHYNLTESDNGQLEIFSIIGNKVASYVLTSDEEFFNISVKSLDNGIYMYRFTVNGELFEEGKLIIIK